MDGAKILEYLVNIDKQLQQLKVEFKQLKPDGFQDESSRERNEVKDSNFYNQMKEELDHRDYNQPSKAGSQVKKASSFTEKSLQKPARIRRSVHTMPSDKEEEQRLSSFRRECLSKAIQWNFVDLLNSVSKDFELVLPSWIKVGEARTILQGTDKKMHLRRFLNSLREKDFNAMRSWINASKMNSDVITKVWDTFEEFSDHDLNQQHMKCLHCCLLENVDITHVADYFYSADIMEINIYMRIMETNRPIGAQKELWDTLLTVSSKVTNKTIVSSALTIALSECLENIGNAECRKEYQSLYDQVRKCDDINDILFCHCGEICARSLHPVTCLKSMSLTRVYFSPPTERKREVNSSSSDCGPDSSQSSHSSHSSLDDSLLDHKDVSKSKELSVEADGQQKSCEMEAAFEKRHRKRAQSRQVKDRSRTTDMTTGLVTYSKATSVVRNKYEKKDTRTIENKTTIINAKNVHLGSGFQVLTRSATHSSHGESSSSSGDLSNGTQ